MGKVMIGKSIEKRNIGIEEKKIRNDDGKDIKMIMIGERKNKIGVMKIWLMKEIMV